MFLYARAHNELGFPPSVHIKMCAPAVPPIRLAKRGPPDDLNVW